MHDTSFGNVIAVNCYLGYSVAKSMQEMGSKKAKREGVHGGHYNHSPIAGTKTFIQTWIGMLVLESSVPWVSIVSWEGSDRDDNEQGINQ